MDDRRSPVRAFLGRFVIALVVGSLLMVGVVSGVNREIGHKLDSIPKINLTTAPLPPEGANYLLIGVDNTGGQNNEFDSQAFGDRSDEKNSDTMMVIHVEPQAERTLIVSFPRDLWVNIPGHGYSKLNGAFQYGPQMVIDTLKSNFDVDINHYIQLNFVSFVDLVNTLGNVPVYVPYAARDENTGLGLPNGGCWPLDGEQSLQWVRSRSLQYLDERTHSFVPANVIAPDLGRIVRQQDFMRRLAGIAVTKSLANPFTANEVADDVVANLKVDDAFDKGAIFDLIDAFRTLNPSDTSALQFEIMPTRAGNETMGGTPVSVLYPLTELSAPLIERLKTFDTRPHPTPAPATIRMRIVNASGRDDLGVAVKRRFEELGFVVTDEVESTGTRQADTVVRYATGQLDKAKLLVRYLEPQPNLNLADVPITNADVEVVLGRSFTAIAVPADAVSTTTTTPTATDVTDDTIIDTPLDLPSAPADVVLPNPAPRGAC